MSKISWQRWPPFVLYTNKRAKTQMSICKMENIFRCTLVKKRKGKKSLHALMTKRQRRGRRRGQPELEMNVAERGRKAINRPRLSEREGPFSPHMTDCWVISLKNKKTKQKKLTENEEPTIRGSHTTPYVWPELFFPLPLRIWRQVVSFLFKFVPCF